MSYSKGAAYTASKHAAVGLTKNTATYYAQKGIRCNAVLPGAMRTPMAVEGVRGEYNHDGVAHIQKYAPDLGKEWVEVKEVADLALFLSNDSSNGLNGQLISADRGFLQF
jgi:NAD(P)-dependent dehydrogenase (short-subunit alcohol dehydrogenase family)